MAPSYDQLPFMPGLIALMVCEQEYKGRMTDRQRNDFANHVERRRQTAYQHQAPWFMWCVNARGNLGRDRLYIWVQHWLAGFLMRQDTRRES